MQKQNIKCFNSPIIPSPNGSCQRKQININWLESLHSNQELLKNTVTEKGLTRVINAASQGSLTHSPTHSRELCTHMHTPSPESHRPPHQEVAKMGTCRTHLTSSPFLPKSLAQAAQATGIFFFL